MGWEKRAGGTRHYYVGHRVRGRVKKLHLGAAGTPAAEVASFTADAIRSHRARIRELRAPLRAAERAVVSLMRLSRRTAAETLEAAGYRRVGRHWRFAGRPGRPAAGRPPARELVPGDDGATELVTNAIRGAVDAVAAMLPSGDAAGPCAASERLGSEIRFELRPGAVPAEQAAAAAVVLARAAADHGRRYSDGGWTLAWADRAARRVPAAEAAAARLAELLDRPS